MIRVQIDQRVEVTQDIPELELHCGDMGLVCSTWFGPAIAYEVEFQRKLPVRCVRAFLMPNQIRARTELQVKGESL